MDSTLYAFAFRPHGDFSLAKGSALSTFRVNPAALGRMSVVNTMSMYLGFCSEHPPNNRNVQK